MIENNNILNSVFKLYDTNKLNAENTAYEINKALESDDKWQENRYAIKNLSMQIAKAEFNEDLNLANTLKERRDLLKEERAKILKSKGLTEKDLIPNYTCPLCKDTGYVENNKLCSCFYSNLAKICNDVLNISKPNLPTFENFKEDSVADKKVKAMLLDYVEKFPPQTIKNLIFLGSPGTGKTFSAGCIASALIENNKNVIYLSALKLNDVFMRYHLANASDKQAIFSLLTECDLLVIDDLGTEPILKNVTVEYLTAVLSERISNQAPFIITTNLNVVEIQKRYTERLSSRLSGKETARISFEGKDKRKIK